jgi:hypothetical protein
MLTSPSAVAAMGVAVRAMATAAANFIRMVFSFLFSGSPERRTYRQLKTTTILIAISV